MSLFTYLLGWNKNPKHIYAVFFFNAYGNWFVLCHVNFVCFFCNHCLVNFLTIKGLTSACKYFWQRVTLMLKNLWVWSMFSYLASIKCHIYYTFKYWYIDYRHNRYFSSIVPKDYCMVLIWISESDNLWTLNINWYSETIISFENSFHMD